MEITVTDSALRQLRRLGVGEEMFLRLSVKRGGCAGMLYDAVLDDAMTEDDEILYDRDGLRLVAHWQFGPHLEGVIVNFSEDLIGPGFTIKNPNADTACGCGASFSTDGVVMEVTTGGCGG